MRLQMAETLKRHLRRTHPHNPRLFGKLLLLLTDGRMLNHVFDYNNYRRLIEFQEVMPRVNPLVKEGMSPEGRVYGVLSTEVVKHICDGVTLDSRREDKTRTKSNVSKRRKRSAVAVTKSEDQAAKSLRWPAKDFHFFKPPEELISAAPSISSAECLELDMWSRSSRTQNASSFVCVHSVACVGTL